MSEAKGGEGTVESKNTGIITGLAELPREAILDEAALANVFGVVTRTIKRMVDRYELPPPILLASKRCWKVGAVLDWINASIERTEKDAKRQVQQLNATYKQNSTNTDVL